MVESKRWNKQGRRIQSERMKRNMKQRWVKVKSDPALLANESRLRSLYAQSGQPLAVWMTNPAVALTQESLGKMLGVSAMTVSNWVSGRARPRRKTIDKLIALAKEYPVKLDMKWAE